MAGVTAQDQESCQFPFLLDEKPAVVLVRVGQRAVGRDAKGPLSRRSLELRTSGAVGLRWQAVYLFQIV